MNKLMNELISIKILTLKLYIGNGLMTKDKNTSYQNTIKNIRQKMLNINNVTF